MSFSSDAKAELCRSTSRKKCCALAEAYGVLLYCSTFSPREIRIVTASGAFAQTLPGLFRRAFSLEFDSLPDEGATGKRRFLITDMQKIETIFRAFGNEASETITLHINLGMLENDCCKSSFVRGAFLAGGSITDPNKSYHLEIVTGHRSVSREFFSVLLELGFDPREAKRGAAYMTYFKQSDAMADFLTTIGAPISAMGIMSTKVEKDMINSINRKVNCDTANVDKTVAAAQAQLAAIRRLERDYGLEELPEGLQQAALLRIANPEVSLSDLALLSDPPVTKSCLSHRLRKLVTMSGGK